MVIPINESVSVVIAIKGNAFDLEGDDRAFFFEVCDAVQPLKLKAEARAPKSAGAPESQEPPAARSPSEIVPEVAESR